MSVVRKCLWHSAFRLSGGISVTGSLPPGGCVVVANHGSHADAPALLAALDHAHRPLVAAAADYWFATPVRSAVCRAFVAGFPVRRTGGGTADLDVARRALAEGRAVVLFPEGTRSRDGAVGDFHRGAFRLAAEAGVPVVPVGLCGTRGVLPVHGSLGRARVAVRIGAPVHDVERARARVQQLARPAAYVPGWRRAVVALALVLA